MTIETNASNFDESEARDRLVVYLHGYQTYLRKDHSLFLNVRQTYPDADIFRPVLPHARRFSTDRLAKVTADLLDVIDKLWLEREGAGHPYDEIILIGHSTGAVLARKVFVCAQGEVTWRDNDGSAGEIDKFVSAPFEPPLAERDASPWSGRVCRIVLLAAMSRGWSISGVKSRLEAFVWSVGSLIGHLMPVKPTIFDIRRGAPFIVQTRLQWLALMDPRSGFDSRNVIVTQLLGTVDNLVAPDDSLDFSVDNENNNFFMVQVPFSTHTSVLEMADTNSATGPQRVRSEKFQIALSGSASEIRSVSIPRTYMRDQLPPEPDKTVSEAVFVIHGIRDLGHWTHKIAAEIKRKSEGSIRSLTPSYGFFAMAPFALPWVRRQKAEWFMDHYVQARAAYPNANFSYVGHSNGTYILARALEDYPACRVRNVVFAGSVVRVDYDWETKINERRVSKVLNYVATNDWVVAGLPYAVRTLKWFDLGGAGHVGFPESGGLVRNFEFVRGAHSAAIAESQWRDIAEFIVAGTMPNKENTEYEGAQPLWIKVLGFASPIIITLLVVGLLLLLGWFGVSAFFIHNNAWMALAFIGLIWIIRTVLTRI